MTQVQGFYHASIIFQVSSKVPTRLDVLKNAFAAKLDGLHWIERAYRMACKSLGHANRAEGIEGERYRIEAMRCINECRKSLRDAEAQCLKARDALRLWPGVADRILRDA